MSASNTTFHVAAPARPALRARRASLVLALGWALSVVGELVPASVGRLMVVVWARLARLASTA
jgi:hypothetical protein